MTFNFTYASDSGLDPPPRRKAHWLLAGAGTLAVHAGLVAVAALISAGGGVIAPVAAVTELINFDLPPAPSPASTRSVSPPITRPRLREAHRSPPPAAAPAGQALAPPEEVTDFADTIVPGTGTKQAGDVTESNGTAARAVTDLRATAGGVEGGVSTRLDGDLSRGPRPADGLAWDCPFPIEADDAGLDHARVTLRLEVDAEGRVRGVQVTVDPGAGFGREARAYALSRRWLPALDRAGQPISGVAIVNVLFDR